MISPAVSVTFRPLRCGGIRDDEKEQRENSRTESSFVRTDQEQRPVRQNQCKNRSQFCRTDQEQRPVLSEQIKNRAKTGKIEEQNRTADIIMDLCCCCTKR